MPKKKRKDKKGKRKAAGAKVDGGDGAKAAADAGAPAAAAPTTTAPVDGAAPVAEHDDAPDRAGSGAPAESGVGASGGGDGAAPTAAVAAGGEPEAPAAPQNPPEPDGNAHPGASGGATADAVSETSSLDTPPEIVDPSETSSLDTAPEYVDTVGAGAQLGDSGSLPAGGVSGGDSTRMASPQAASGGAGGDAVGGGGVMRAEQGPIGRPKPAASSHTAGTAHTVAESAVDRPVTPEMAAAGEQFRRVLLLGLPQREGTLLKLGGVSFGLSALKSWKERWFAIRGPNLVYFTSQPQGSGASAAKPKLSLSLDGATVKTSDFQLPNAPSQYSFTLHTSLGYSLAMVAPDKDTRDAWVGVIDGVIRTLRAFPPPVLDVPAAGAAQGHAPVAASTPPVARNGTSASSAHQVTPSGQTVGVGAAATASHAVAAPPAGSGDRVAPGDGAGGSTGAMASEGRHDAGEAAVAQVGADPIEVHPVAHHEALDGGGDRGPTCSACGTLLEPGHRFCDECGTPVPGR